MNRFTTAAFCLMMATSVYGQIIPEEDVKAALNQVDVMLKIEQDYRPEG